MSQMKTLSDGDTVYDIYDDSALHNGSVPPPTGDSDAATKQYVDEQNGVIKDYADEKDSALLNSEHALYYRGDLTSSSNPDDYHTTGWYTVGQMGNGPSFGGSIGTPSYSFLINFQGPSNPYVTQFLLSGITIYIRRFSGNPPTWSAWTQIGA